MIWNCNIIKSSPEAARRCRTRRYARSKIWSEFRSRVRCNDRLNDRDSVVPSGDSCVGRLGGVADFSHRELILNHVRYGKEPAVVS